VWVQRFGFHTMINGHRECVCVVFIYFIFSVAIFSDGVLMEQFWRGWSALRWVTLISAELHVTGRERNGIKHQGERLEIGLKQGDRM